MRSTFVLSPTTYDAASASNPSLRVSRVKAGIDAIDTSQVAETHFNKDPFNPIRDAAVKMMRQLREESADSM